VESSIKAKAQKCWLIDEEGSRVAGKPAAKVRERHGHGVGDDRLPGGPVRPAAGIVSRPNLLS